jgi:hypothetical protein
VVKAVAGGRPVVDVKNAFSAGPAPINVLPVKSAKPPFDLAIKAIFEFDAAEETGEPAESAEMRLISTQRARSNRLVLLDGCGKKLAAGDMLRVKEAGG